jgi:hypothetical protein
LIQVRLPDGRLLKFPDGTSEEAVKATARRMSAAASPDEDEFRQWYSRWATVAGLDPNPDSPAHRYDYRAAFRAGMEPEISPEDGLYHWRSAFKSADHPNRFVNGVDTKESDMRLILEEQSRARGETLPETPREGILARIGVGAAGPTSRSCLMRPLSR